MKALTLFSVFGLIFSIALAQEQSENLSPLVVEEQKNQSVIPNYFPGNASVISEEEITKSGAKSLADLLNNQGGVRITSFSGNASGGSVSLRGFGENSSSRVLILVDGRAVNRPDIASVSLQEVPLSRIDRVEILRGSQTARFGDNAVGGVVNIITKICGSAAQQHRNGAGERSLFAGPPGSRWPLFRKWNRSRLRAKFLRWLAGECL
ncbi:MAG: Plug domain-containing protein [Akkermansiaceae bacterium]|nr:Plug domain-containing protein [Akkermansiaceae bacterium]